MVEKNPLDIKKKLTVSHSPHLWCPKSMKFFRPRIYTSSEYPTPALPLYTSSESPTPTSLPTPASSNSQELSSNRHTLVYAVPKIIHKVALLAHKVSLLYVF